MLELTMELLIRN